MAWYNSSWLYRQKITVDATQVDEVFSLLPIYTSKLNMHFFDHAKAAAADIRITRADGTTEVARYIVAHDATARTGCIIANVSADVSISTNTDYYVYYGNSAASDHATSATYGRDATFSDYAGAYMPGMTTADLTGGGRTLTANGSPTTAASNYEGITAAAYNGTSQYHSYSGTQAITDVPYTLEALAYSTSSTANQCAVSLGRSSSGTNGYCLLRMRGDVASDPIRFSIINNSGSISEATTSTGYTTSTWCQVAGTRDALTTGTTTAYINGGSAGTNTTNLGTAPTWDRLGIGATVINSVVNYLAGRVAVVLIDNAARTADYMTTMYDAWHSSTFWTAGAIETEFGGMTGWRLFQTAATTTASGSHQDWSNPSNALTVNADAATAVLDETTWLLSETLKLTNPDYGITIPSGESTYECQFRVARTGQTSSAKEIRDYNVQFIDDTGTLVGTNLADTGTVWPATATNKDYTVAGVSLTSTKFDADTGIAIQADGTNTNGSTTASVITGWINVIWESSGSTTGGTGALTLPAPLALSGAGGALIAGTGALTLKAPTLSGAGSVLVAGSGNLDLPGIEIIGSGGNAAITGSGNLNLPVIDLAGAGSVVIVGSGNLNLPVIEIDGAMTPTTTGWFLFQNATTGSASLPDVRAWTDVSGALDETSPFAYVSVGGSGDFSYETAALVVRNPLGISIPDGSQITSIEYKIDRLGNVPLTGTVYDHEIRAFKGGVAVGDNLAKVEAWSHDVSETVEYGPSLMGVVWGANDFGSDFGLSIVCNAEYSDPSYGFVATKIQTVWCRINYSTVAAIGGDGALELPSITLDTPPNPTGGTAALELPLFTMKGHSYNALCSCCEGYTMRTLIELRRMLVQQSGHAELVADYENEDWADNGADHFIQAGQRFCDDQFQYHKSEAWFYAKVAAGESLVTFTNARIIKQVWLNYTGGNRVLLERLTLDKMREEYTEPLLSSETQGTPAYWVPAVLGLAPQQYTDTALTFDAEGITDYDLIMFGNHYPYKGIYIMPPADGDYTVEIKAEWYSHEMCEDSDVSFWSQYPELLLMAARRQMEIDLHRNSTGAQDFEAPLMRSLMKLSHNLVAEEWSGPTKVRGEC